MSMLLLLSKREQCSAGKAPKVEFVHPVARCIFETIQSSVPLPDVHLYIEQINSQDQSTTRRTDLLFYHHVGTALESLNACMQRNGLLSIELNSILDSSAHDKVAMAELLRDFAHTIGEGAETAKRTFFGLVGDGVSWIATQWQIVVGGIGKKFHAVRSERFELDLYDEASLTAFVTRILRLRAGAAAQSRHNTGWEVRPLSLGANHCISVDRVLGVTESCVVVQCDVVDGTKRRTVALKIQRASDMQERCAKEVAVRAVARHVAAKHCRVQRRRVLRRATGDRARNSGHCARRHVFV
jgi:hypothetical protein